MRRVRFIAVLVLLALAEGAVCWWQEHRPGTASLRVEQALTVREVPELRGYLGERWEANRKGSLEKFDIEQFVRMVEVRNHKDWWWIGEQDGKWLESAILSSLNSDSVLRDKARFMLDRVIASQEPDGYVGITPREVRTAAQPLRGMDPYELYFTLHAFITAYEQWGDTNALHAARRLGDYFVDHIGPGKAEFWPGDVHAPENKNKVLDGHSQIAGHSVHYGWEGTLLIDPMLRLAQVTGDQRYTDWGKWVVQNIDKWSGWDSFSKLDLVADGKMGINEVQPYVHAHTFQMNFLGFLRLYEITRDPSLLRKVTGAWQDIANRQMYITGGVSVGEHYETGHLKPVMGGVVETCATMSWLQLTEYLLELTGDVKYADAMEKLLWNHVFASQTIDGDCYRYHTAPDGVKPDGYFHGPDCCTASGFRLVSLLPTFLYGKDARGLFVNQYGASTVDVNLPGRRKLRVRQETAYPESDTISLKIESAPFLRLAIHLRLPGWCANPKVWLNGKPQMNVTPGKFIPVIDRRWQAGDEIKLTFPMALQWVQADAAWNAPAPAGSNAAPWALTRGPMVYAVDTLWWEATNVPAPAQAGDDLAVIPDLAEVREVPKPPGIFGPAYEAAFETSSGEPVRAIMVPFTDMGRWYRDDRPKPAPNAAAYSYALWLQATNSPPFQQRLTVNAEQRAWLARATDYVTIGNAKSESDHQVQGGTGGDFLGRGYHHGNEFSYLLKVKPDQNCKLVVMYWGDDVGREFDILANDRLLARQKLEKNRPGTFYEESYNIPGDLVHGKTDNFGKPVDHVTIRFKAHNSATAGGVFGLRVE